MSAVLSPPLLKAISSQFRLSLHSPHGPAHWMRVRRNGIELAPYTGANTRVVELFAVFHDSCRESDHHDPLHGPRGADLAQLCRELELFTCSDDELEVLQAACHGHTHEPDHPDPTIATCWDADRLDLPRVGIIPVPHRLCTRAARAASMIEKATMRAEQWVSRQYGYR